MEDLWEVMKWGWLEETTSEDGEEDLELHILLCLSDLYIYQNISLSSSSSQEIRVVWGYNKWWK